MNRSDKRKDQAKRRKTTEVVCLADHQLTTVLVNYLKAGGTDESLAELMSDARRAALSHDDDK
jgi:hypothetical protein